jgi:predicted O-methyltransferase YrrM
MYPIIDQIFSTQSVQSKDGISYPLRGNIDFNEGLFIHNLISADESINRTLEVGCGHGISSLFICDALKNKVDKKHLIIDPNQDTNYNGIGISNLEKAGVSFFNFIPEKSEFALPKLAQTSPGEFDLIFIDGLHSFDQVLLDFYYANILVRTGGIIIFDDCSFYSISKAIVYILGYPAYKFHSQVKETSSKKRLLGLFFNSLPDCVKKYIFPLKLNNFSNRFRFSSMIALIKVGEDVRCNQWFTEF